MIPDRPESFYEVGFMLYRRFSIFYISFIMFVNSFGLIVVYFIVFGDISISLHKAVTGDEDDDLILNQRYPYIIVLCSSLVPLIIKKELAELKIISWFLFFSIFLFLVITAGQIIIVGEFTRVHSISDFLKPYTDSSVLNSISNILVAFNYQQNLFPIYSALEDKTPKGSTKAVTSGLTVTFSLYITMGILSIFLFGEGIESSVMTNVNNNEHNSAASYVLRICFAIVLACHIPFLFFSGKEAVLIIVDEY